MGKCEFDDCVALFCKINLGKCLKGHMTCFHWGCTLCFAQQELKPIQLWDAMPLMWFVKDTTQHCEMSCCQWNQKTSQQNLFALSRRDNDLNWHLLFSWAMQGCNWAAMPCDKIGFVSSNSQNYTEMHSSPESLMLARFTSRDSWPEPEIPSLMDTSHPHRLGNGSELLRITHGIHCMGLTDLNQKFTALRMSVVPEVMECTHDAWLAPVWHNGCQNPMAEQCQDTTCACSFPCHATTQHETLSHSTQPQLFVTQRHSSL